MSFLGRPKLREPLDKDTFEHQTVDEKKKRITDDDKADISNYRVWAERYAKDAEDALNLFKQNMRNIFSKTCDYPGIGTNHILPEGQGIGDLKVCIKSVYSIMEKMASDKKETEGEARNNIQDVIRGRVVLKHGSQKEGDKICDQIINAVNRGKLEIKEIINYYSNDDEKYISDNKMNALRNAIDKKYGADSYKYENKQKISGYNSVHIIVKVNKDFDAELQIMGRDVERLKDVEDVFYKLRHNKATHAKYNKIAEAYRNMSDEDKEVLDQYTREAYLAQRNKELNGCSVNERGKFVKLDTKKYNLPKIFDFNNIATISY